MDFMEESARVTAEDVERLKQLIDEKAEMRRGGLLKQRRPVIKIELEDEEGEAGVEPEMEGGRTPELKLEIKQELEKLEVQNLESGLKLEIKQEPGQELEKATDDEERGSWQELDQNEPFISCAAARSGLDGDLNPHVFRDQNVDPEGLLKKSVKTKIQKVKPKLGEDNWEVSPLLPDGWKFHQGSRVFRTSTGDALQSYSKALQHMMVTEGYSDKQMDNLQRFIEEKDAVGVEWNSDLEDMEVEHHTDLVKVEKSVDKRKRASSDTRNASTQIAQSETPLKNSVKDETKTQWAKKNISPSVDKEGGNGDEGVTSKK